MAKPMPIRGNAKATITSLSVNYAYDGFVTISSEIITASPEFVRVFQNSMFDPLTTLRLTEDEWMCAYCGSPNPLSNRHCSQCGGPRGFVLGGRA